MEKGRAYARELLNCRGLYYPVGIGPAGLSLSAILTAGRKNCKETLWNSIHRKTRNSGLPGFDTDYV
ncbi:MAG: hypothetical protein KBS72_07350 [Bacteroidales bacterium]|nr:hypothetical protein [Candidatus Cacconaster scatequi]